MYQSLNWREKLSAASVTVETALLMPIILFTVFMTVYLTAHVHGRAYLAARCGEQAVSGKEQEEPQLFAVGGVSTRLNDSILERSVTGTAGTYHYTGERLWQISETQIYKKYRPVELIRKRNAVKKLGN